GPTSTAPARGRGVADPHAGPSRRSLARSWGLLVADGRRINPVVPARAVGSASAEDGSQSRWAGRYNSESPILPAHGGSSNESGQAPVRDLESRARSVAGAATRDLVARRRRSSAHFENRFPMPKRRAGRGVAAY